MTEKEKGYALLNELKDNRAFVDAMYAMFLASDCWNEPIEMDGCVLNVKDIHKIDKMMQLFVTFIRDC